MAQSLFHRLFGLSFVLALIAAGCGASPEGVGIGWPPGELRTTGPTHGVRLSRLRAPQGPADTATFLELINESDLTLDTGATPFWVQSLAGSVQLPATVWAPHTALQLTGASLQPLHLHATAGDLLLLGPDLTVEAYASWGAAPSSLPGNLSDVAQAVGFSTAWAPLPYPLSPNVALNLGVTRDAVPCVAADLSLPEPFLAVDCQLGQSPAQLVLSRVQPTGIDPYGPAIEIQNVSTQTLDVQGVQVCLRGVCAPLVPIAQNQSDGADTFIPPAATTAAGAPDASRRRVVLRGGQKLGVSDLVTALPPVRSVDEVVLLAPGRSFSETAAWWGYVRLSPDGATLIGLDAEALRATPYAAWQNVTLPGPKVAGECLARQTQDTTLATTPAAYRLDAQNFGTALDDPNLPYNACSAPRIAAATTLVVHSIAQANTAWLVTLVNTTDAPLQLRDYSLAQGDKQRSLFSEQGFASVAELAPYESLRLAMAPDQQGCSTFENDVCWSDNTLVFARNELSVLHEAALVAHLQWGGQAASLLGAEALQVGAWPAPRCRIEDFGSGTQGATLTRLPYRPGQAPSDYRVTASGAL